MERKMDDSWWHHIGYGIISNKKNADWKKYLISFQYNKLINNINEKHTQDFIARIFNPGKKEIETDKYVAPIIAFVEHFSGSSK